MLGPAGPHFGSLSLVSMGHAFPINYNQPASTLALQVLQHFGGNLDFLSQAIACLREKPYDVWLDVWKLFNGSSSEANCEIKPVVSFEIVNACCCRDRSRFVHSVKNAMSDLFSNPASKDHEDVLLSPYEQCSHDQDCLSLCLQCIGRKSLELLTSSQVRCSTSDLDLRFEELSTISFETSNLEDSFECHGNIAFSRPERDVTRYFMTTATFVALLSLGKHALRTDYTAIQQTIARMSAPTANAAFLGRFIRGSPA